MHTDHLLILSQWFSPAYPLGSFAYSHGMETAIQERRIINAAQLEKWLRIMLEHGTGRSDAILFHGAHACEAEEEVEALDVHTRAYAPSAERLLESALQGDAFCRTTMAVWDMEMPVLTHPVAVGYAAGRLGLPALPTATLYLQAFAANLVSCAVRLVPLGQTEGQEVLMRLSDLIATIATTAAQQRPDEMASATFAADIDAMRHETLEHRTFRT
ncbi:UNVERIFIED_CONTAM: hypothetical protein GTU68_007448 [Idotea baltica]|nr:hypothetical protein [Idotea baltica]